MFKGSKFYVIICVTLAILFSSCNSNDEANAQREYTENLINEMGFDKSGKVVTREQFKIFLVRLIAKGMQVNTKDEGFYTSVVQKIIETVPMEFDVKDLTIYLNPQSFQEIFRETVTANYGKDVMDDFDKKDVINKTLNNQNDL